MLPKEKIDGLVSRVKTIDDRLSAPIDRDTLVRLSKERAELEPVYLAIADLQSAEKEREGLNGPLDDPEMGPLASEEARHGGLVRRIHYGPSCPAGCAPLCRARPIGP